jgi:hypothetical protein
MNSSSTRPMKKGRPRIHPIRDKPGLPGRPKATGIFETRAEFEAACLDKHNQGWSLRRIGHKPMSGNKKRVGTNKFNVKF